MCRGIRNGLLAFFPQRILRTLELQKKGFCGVFGIEKLVKSLSEIGEHLSGFIIESNLLI
jgi:hypothetical protein